MLGDILIDLRNHLPDCSSFGLVLCPQGCLTMGTDVIGRLSSFPIKSNCSSLIKTLTSTLDYLLLLTLQELAVSPPRLERSEWKVLP